MYWSKIDDPGFPSLRQWTAVNFKNDIYILGLSVNDYKFNEISVYRPGKSSIVF